MKINAKLDVEQNNEMLNEGRLLLFVCFKTLHYYSTGVIISISLWFLREHLTLLCKG